MTDQSPPDTPHGRSTGLFRRSSWPEAKFVGEVLRRETIGGALLLVAAAIALAWANSPWSGAYAALGEVVPFEAATTLHLDLTLREWAADGLLAIFFFVVGIEVKREFVAGDLRDPRRAALPVAAAIGGMIMPALIYVAINLASPDGSLSGWAVPTATDIAFALAVLAVIGSHLPHAMRAFLLTLAVVDDLIAIMIIAIFFTSDFSLLPLLAALVPLVAFAALLQRGRTWWWALLPLAFACWTLVHASGVHATVAGVLLGFAVPVMHPRRPDVSLAKQLEHRWQPVSAGFAVPVFAFFAAGVTLESGALREIATDPVVIGIVAGLVLGKSLGTFGATVLVARLIRARPSLGIGWWDLLGLALLAGIGFTVSLLIGELAFGVDSDRETHVRAAVLAGSLVAASLAAVVLVRRNAHHRRLWEEENRDDNRDGVPDVYERA